MVHAKPPFGGPEHVFQYLARYTHRVAISNGRLLSLENAQVTFRWRDSKDRNRETRWMSLVVLASYPPKQPPWTPGRTHPTHWTPCAPIPRPIQDPFDLSSGVRPLFCDPFRQCPLSRSPWARRFVRWTFLGSMPGGRRGCGESAGGIVRGRMGCCETGWLPQWPVPVSATDWEPPAALSVIVSEALLLPAEVGLKLTEMVQLVPAFRLPPQALFSVN